MGPLALVMPRAVPMGYSQQLYDRYVTGARSRFREATGVETSELWKRALASPPR